MSLAKTEFVYCIKEFIFDDKRGIPCKFEIGKKYEYWINFGGLNHFVKHGENEAYPFDGDMQFKDGVTSLTNRPYIFEYFCFKDDHRDLQLDKIGI